MFEKFPIKPANWSWMRFVSSLIAITPPLQQCAQRRTAPR